MPHNAFTLKVGKASTTLHTTDGTRVARVEVFHPQDHRNAEWGILPAQINYPIMGDNTPEFAELMAYTLQRAAELARGLDKELENEINQKRAAERDR